MTNVHDFEIDLPLIVDLDGTLTVTDTLHESFARLVFRAPAAAAGSLLHVLQGPAVVKRFIAERSPLGVTTLPYRNDLIDLLKREKARGRPIHLITAADQSIADAVSAEFGLFDSATGSNGRDNLKGENKFSHVRNRFANGYIYAGDDASDLHVFRGARGAILCGASADLVTRVKEAGVPVIAQFSGPSSSPKDWLRVARIHQWVKNVLIFVPLVVGHAFGDSARVAAVTLGFLLLCALSSATYIVNDLADLDADRAHPTKRQRPFASGRLKIIHGFVAAPLLITATLISAYVLLPRFAAALFAYLVMTSAYSFGLKRIPLLDVFVIGALFTLRIVMGAEIAGVGHSPWLLSFSLAFFLALALAKRHAEVVRAAHVDVDEILGRGYRGNDWPITLAFGVGAGLVSVVIMLLYMTNDAAPSGFYHSAGWLYAIPALLTIWLMRIWLLSNRMQLHDDPVVFALRDPVSLALGAGVVCAFFLAI